MTEYIRREDLMERVGRWQLNTREAIVEMIMSVPSADVRPVVRGRDIYNTVNGHCEFKCSVCGVELAEVYGGYNDFGLDGGYFNFCPNCGAQMESEGE